MPTTPTRQQLRRAYDDQPKDFLCVTRLDSVFDQPERKLLEAAVDRAVTPHTAPYELVKVQRRGGLACFPTCACSASLWAIDTNSLSAYLALFGSVLAHAPKTCLPCLRSGALAIFAAWIIGRGSPGTEAMAATTFNVLACRLGPTFAADRNGALPTAGDCQCNGDFSRLRWCDAYRPSQPDILDGILARVMEHTGNLRQTLSRLVLSLPRTLPADYYALDSYHLGITSWYLMSVEINEGAATGLMPAMIAWAVPLEHASQQSLEAGKPPELPPWCPDEEIFSALIRTRGSTTRSQDSLRAKTYDEYVAWRLTDGIWIASLACVDVNAARKWAVEAETGQLDTLSGDAVSIFDGYSKARGLKEDRFTDATCFDRVSSSMTDAEVHPYRALLCKNSYASALDYVGCGISGWQPSPYAAAGPSEAYWYSSVWSNLLLGPTLTDDRFLEWCAAVKAAGGSTDDLCPDGASCVHPARYHTYALGETLRYLQAWWGSSGKVTSTMITDFGEAVDGCRSRWQAGEGKHDPGCSIAQVAPWPSSLYYDLFMLRCVTHHAILWASLRTSLNNLLTAGRDIQWE
ncbi:hypothetical protein NLG97_g3824 [Lecanicillium saksenae]|uniref:Uncharacterized protein n=1 Tax=Lecanicillium saksenae TaxID=468837 RepID=A0ACC1QYP6_9HYPO|nr:hypothetical protein NLG97_g3824 [Lecanicillium saksenae]